MVNLTTVWQLNLPLVLYSKHKYIIILKVHFVSVSMQYKTITYKRIRNLENYESEHLELSVEIDEQRDIGEQIKDLKNTVRRNLGLVSEQIETNESQLEEFKFKNINEDDKDKLEYVENPF